MNEKEEQELVEKIKKGLELSFKRLVLQKRKENEMLVFSNKDDEIVYVNAKDIKID